MRNKQFYKDWFLIGALGLLIIFGINLYIKNILLVKQDWGDAPKSYGNAIHTNPNEGPYFGQKRGDDDSKNLNDSIPFAMGEALLGDNDDVFNDSLHFSSFTFIIDSATSAFFAPDIIVEKST